MRPFLWQWMDRVAIRHAAAHMPRPDGRDLRIDQARLALQSPDLFPTDHRAAAVEFDDPVRFHFQSRRPSEHAVNNIVHGRFYRCAEQWRQRPAIVLLHGWNDSLNHYYYFPRHARRLNRIGFNAATLQMPWQFARRPRELGRWGNILTADLMHTFEGTLQALADIRSYVNYLFEQGCPFVGLWGVSMGAWFAGLTACSDPRIGCAALIVPVARLDQLIEELEFCTTIRSALLNQNLDFSRLNLVSNRPVIDRGSILILEAEHDLFVAKRDVEELWQAWDKPEIWRVPVAHISILFVRGLADRVVQWIAARARQAVAK